MATEIPKKCPSCNSNMHIQILKCPICETEVQGDFSLGRFSDLTEEQLDFLEIFIRCRGNLKDVGSAFGISYPTARNRLDDLINALDFEQQNETSQKRIDILNQLKNGTITTEEALLLLGGNKNE